MIETFPKSSFLFLGRIFPLIGLHDWKSIIAMCRCVCVHVCVCVCVCVFVYCVCVCVPCVCYMYNVCIFVSHGGVSFNLSSSSSSSTGSSDPAVPVQFHNVLLQLLLMLASCEDVMNRQVCGGCGQWVGH